MELLISSIIRGCQAQTGWLCSYISLFFMGKYKFTSKALNKTTKFP